MTEDLKKRIERAQKLKQAHEAQKAKTAEKPPKTKAKAKPKSTGTASEGTGTGTGKGPGINDKQAYEMMVRGLKEVCADASNPRFYDAVKLLADLKGWKNREPSAAERIDAIDPASVVQLIVTAVDAHRPVQDILDRFMRRGVTSAARSASGDS